MKIRRTRSQDYRETQGKLLGLRLDALHGELATQIENVQAERDADLAILLGTAHRLGQLGGGLYQAYSRAEEA